MPFGGDPEKERQRVKRKPIELVPPSVAAREEEEIAKKLKPKRKRCYTCEYWDNRCKLGSVSCLSGGASSYKRRRP